MRHPEAEQIARRVEEALPTILERAGQSPQTSLRRDREGWVNLCYLGERVVVRVNARDPELPKFKREAHVYERLYRRGFPVPKVLLHDESPTCLDSPILVTTRHPGQNLEASWPTLDTCSRHRLARDAGALLADLHGVKFPGSGEVFEPSTPTWQQYTEERTDRFLSLCDSLNLFHRATIDRFHRALYSAAELIAPPRGSRLVHGDYHFGNLLHDGDHLTGVVDFEWAFAGDRTWDLVHQPTMDDDWPDSADAFRRGYESRRAWPDDFPLRRATYQCLRNLELCTVAARFLSAEECRSYCQTTRNQLEDVEKLVRQ